MSELAIRGGPPIRTAPWPHYPTFGQEEKRAVNQVIDSGWLVGLHNPAGPGQTGAFEQAFSAWVGSKHTVAVGNGTEGLHLALAAAEIGVNDEVIVPTFTFMATATAVLMQNAVPVFADSETDTMGLDPRDVERKITPRTKAIMPVHLCGYPAKMDELLAVARAHDLVVIEDCSHAHGALYHGRKVGTLGDIGVFSLQQKKNLCTGDGGLVVTDNDQCAQAVRRLRSFGGTELNYNYRMTEFAAAVGQVRLKALDEDNRVRQANAQCMGEELSGVPGVVVRKPIPGTVGVYYSLLMEYEAHVVGVSRQEFIEAVRAEGIPIAPTYTPVHRNPIFHPQETPARGCPWQWALYTALQGERPDYDNGSCPVAEEWMDGRLIELKVHPPVSRGDIKMAAAAIRKVIDLIP